MCLSSVKYYNRSRLVSTLYQQRYIIHGSCGKCAECQSKLHNEFYLRIYYQWLDTLESPNSYVLFDTYTYSDVWLPHFSDFFPINGLSDFSCHNREHWRLFYDRLQKRVKYDGYDFKRCVKYFCAAEYGSDDDYIDNRGLLRHATSRPHYHVLWFVRDIPLSKFKGYLRDSWTYGRTDDIRQFGNRANVFRCRNNQSELGVSNYVAKYVQKLSAFQSELDKRLNHALMLKYVDDFTITSVSRSQFNIDAELLGWSYCIKHLKFQRALEIKQRVNYDAYSRFLRSWSIRCEKAAMLRHINQYHLQSQGLGLRALRDVDVEDLMRSGFLTMPDKQKVVRKVALPKYFERKLFEQQVKLANGLRIWQPTKLGLKWRAIKQQRNFDRIRDKYETLFIRFDYHPDRSASDIARYIVYCRGRIKGDIPKDPLFEDFLNTSFTYYNYVCPSDEAYYHYKFVTKQYTGLVGSYTNNDFTIDVKEFVRKYVYYDAELEQIIAECAVLLHRTQVGKQDLFDYRQRMR